MLSGTLNYGLAIMLYESNKCGEISEFDSLWAQSKRRRGQFFPDFHMWPQFNFQIFRCGLSLDETKRRIEGMVIFYIYHMTNNYGHTNLGAFLLT